jgi:hypothetical protein
MKRSKHAGTERDKAVLFVDVVPLMSFISSAREYIGKKGLIYNPTGRKDSEDWYGQPSVSEISHPVGYIKAKCMTI